MNGPRHALLLSSFLFTFTGCIAGPLDAGQTGVASEPVVVDNAIFPNAIFPNAIFPNAIFPNAIFPNAIFPNALDPASLAAIEDPGEAGVLSRMFVKYAVSCALTPSQSFSFSWTDSSGVVHDETYTGGVGLAPRWATGPLDLTGQRLVSACLAARTNYYGVTVLISMRSGAPPLDAMTPRSELAAYPHVEGAFWGNLFASTPALYACYDPADVAIARSDDRDCAAGHVDSDGEIVPCGPITLVGPCDEHCAKLDEAGGYYTQCHEDPIHPPHKMTKDVITTALP
jgi:hypothetical protein